MNHTIEPAASGRAKCRGCGRAIAKGELRLGERLPNPFSESTDMTHWFHLECGAYKRPVVMLELADAAPDTDGLAEWMIDVARRGIEFRRLPRIDGAERAPSGRARCRNCREPIAAETWRIRLVYYEEGRFNPSGFLHLSCAKEYFETVDITDRLKHFAPDLTADDLAEIEAELAAV